MRRRIVAGNWKMNGTRVALAEFLARLQRAEAPGRCHWLLFPPALLLAEAREAAAELGLGLGVQTLHPEPAGAFTGELAAEMAADAGASWALLGHSERRLLFGESNDDVAARVLAAVRAGLQPMLCLGETLAQREQGRAEEVVLEQLRAVLKQVPAAWTGGAIAYEPVWAIGTGKTASPQQAQAMHGVVRAELERHGTDCAAMPILYGGSVKPDNAVELFAQNDVDGALVGGASLDPEAFLAIIAAMESHG